MKKLENNSIKKAIIGILNNDNNRLTALSKNILEVCVETLSTEFETRVYVVDTEDDRMNDVYWEELTDEEFMFEAEEQGKVYTLDGFAKAFNFEEINSSTDAIRFIQVPVYV
jgi:hypothetical protein